MLMLLTGQDCFSSLVCLARWVFFINVIELVYLFLQFSRPQLLLHFYAFVFELLDVFMFVIAGCKRALQTQFKPCVISGRKVTKPYPFEGRGGRGMMHREIVLVTRL